MSIRNYFITTTFRLDRLFLSTVVDMWRDSVTATASAANMTNSILFQPIVPAITSKSAPAGGNSLGLDPSDGVLVVVLVTISWTAAANDKLIVDTSKALVDTIEKLAKAKGIFSPFKYLNYAAGHQDPFAGYGPKAQANLKAVSRKYDSTRFFQTVVPGGFKLF